MRWEQLVGVTGAGGAGSGYLIAPRLVLTSAHVVGEHTTEVTVIRPGRRGEYTASVAWCGRGDGTTDAALVQIEDPAWEPPRMRPVIWGRIVTHQPGIACRTWGLPDFAQRKGRATDTEQPTGTLNPGDGYGHRHILHLNEYPPTAVGESPWKGISGAAVYCGSLLTGVVATDPDHRGHAALGVVPAYVLLAQSGFREVLERHCGPAGLEWAPVELQDLADHQSPTRAATVAGTPATLLTARRAVVEFRGRHDVLADLRAWASEPGVGMWLVHGAGGQGKTRLAHQLGTELAAQRWSVLWLDPAVDTAERLRVLGQVVTELLVVIDYAEARVPQVGILLTELAAHVGDRPVKVVLLARTVGEWWTQLAATSGTVGDITARTRHTSLLPLDDDIESRHATYRATMLAFAGELPRLADLGGVEWSRAATSVLTRPYRDLGDGTTVLGVQMGALADLLDTHHPTTTPVTGQHSLEDRILEHEYRYWTATATRHDLDGLGLATLKDVLAATIVLGATTNKELGRVLTRVPDLSDQPRLVHTRIRDWLMSLYPGQSAGVYAGLEPDRLAEQLVGRLMLHPTRDCVIEYFAATTDNEGEAEQLLTVCTRAAAHPTLTATADILTAWCVRWPTLHVAAVRVATRVEYPEPLITALDQIAAIPGIPADTLAALHSAIPLKTRVLAATATTLTHALTEHYRHTGNQPLLAASLNNVAIRLGELGRREEGLAAAEESVKIRRRLAEHHPDTYLPDLAKSLNNISVWLGELGRHEEGLAAAEEAMEIHRGLAEHHPDTYLPELAMILNNVTNRLRELGRRQESLAVAEEAMEIHRGLAEHHPDTYLPNLAKCLNNISVVLGELGRHAEGLAAAEEAMGINRRLAEHHPDTYLPDLATSLNNVAVWSGELGRREDSFTAAEEAMEIYRGLAEHHPATYLPSLARSLNNVAVRLGVLGRREEALTATEEAMEIHRGLAEHHPAAHLPDLATSLNNVAIWLGELGRHGEGLAAAEESVKIYRRLAEHHPATYLPNLATSLNNVAIWLGELGRREEGLAAAEESVKIYQGLAEYHPGAYLSDLATSLNNVAVVLGELGRREEGLAAAEESVKIYRRLAEHHPDAYLPELARSLNDVAVVLGELGRREEGLTAAEEAMGIYRLIADRHPAVNGADVERVQTVLEWLRSTPAGNEPD
ncbi:tetratricopeptide repeat-containing protein [Nocardia sp. NPDC050717]|uniref:tetratricopeptide repeat-containing protein n=1 Tax=Nocardia sp. NPDC050717 TaxID=3157221 RepID=UPI0033C4AE87